MSHIFISYSKKNSEYAYALADFLQDKGFNIWIDRIGIEYGVGWWDAIVDGLNTCGAFVVVMTPEARESSWVQREVFLALQKLERKKAIFPLLLNGDNWELFVTTQYADVRDGSLPDGDFLKRVAQHVTPKGKGANQSSLTPEKQAAQPPTPPAPRFDVDGAIADFGRAYRAQNWSEALNILGRIRASGEDPTPFNPNNFEQQVQAAIAEEQRQREQAEREVECQRLYGRVQVMAEYADDTTVWAALQTMWQTFPDYDPDNIADRVRPKPKAPPKVEKKLPRLRMRVKAKATTDDAVRAIIGAPFEWCEIPGGRGTLKTNEANVTLQIPTERYWMAKYPITNAQFAAFIKAGGYRDQKWWTDAGWQQREQDKWTEPRYWTDSNWNGAEQPVVGVSWHEAVAFCLWLSEATGEKILLPTEAQWQYAAQGDNGREYPWGNEFDEAKCNTSESGIGQTTLVTQYPQGASPYGVLDMSGNVWEWCLTDYNNPAAEVPIKNISSDARRVLRGGSWLLNQVSARVASRLNIQPAIRDDNLGFRVVRPPSQ